MSCRFTRQQARHDNKLNLIRSPLGEVNINALIAPPPPKATINQIKESSKSSSKLKQPKANVSPHTPRKIQTTLNNYITKEPTQKTVLSQENGIDFGDEQSLETVILSTNQLFRQDLCSPHVGLLLPKFSCVATSCKYNHKEEVTKQLSEYEEGILRNIISEECWGMLLPPLYKYLTAETFLSAPTLRSLFYCIIHEPNEEVITVVQNFIRLHWYHHPPCKKEMKEIYASLLKSDLSETFFKSELVQYDFLTLFEEIRSVILPEESTKEKVKSYNLTNNDSELPVTVQDFYSYIEKYYMGMKNIYSLPEFRNCEIGFSRKLKEDTESIMYFERAVSALSLMVDLLEMDMVVWLRKFRYKLKEGLIYKPPLIVKLVWKKEERVGAVNELCLSVFKCYVKTVPQHRHLFSRLIALLFEVARASEHNVDLKYPFFDKFCCAFASSLTGCFPSYQKAPEDVISLIKHLKPAWLQLRLAYLFIEPTADNCCEEIHLETILKLVQKKLSEKNPKCSQHQKKRPNKKKAVISVVQNPNKRNHKGETKLHLYCRKNNVKLLETYLKTPEANVNLCDNYGWTPLHEAAKAGSVEAVQLLINYRLPPPRGNDSEPLNINSTNCESITPLMDAVCCNSHPITELLLKYGAASTIWNKSTTTKLCAMELAKDDKMKNLLRTAWDKSTRTYKYLLMSDSQVLLIEVMLAAYFTTYHTNEKIDSADPESGKLDPIYKFNYSVQMQDKFVMGELVLLFSRLSKIPANSRYLRTILRWLETIN